MRNFLHLGCDPIVRDLVVCHENRGIGVIVKTRNIPERIFVGRLQVKFRQMRLRRDPKCPVCGDDPTITELIDYEEFCLGILSPTAAAEAALATT